MLKLKCSNLGISRHLLVMFEFHRSWIDFELFAQLLVCSRIIEERQVTKKNSLIDMVKLDCSLAASVGDRSDTLYILADVL